MIASEDFCLSSSFSRSRQKVFQWPVCYCWTLYQFSRSGYINTGGTILPTPIEYSFQNIFQFWYGRHLSVMTVIQLKSKQKSVAVSRVELLIVSRPSYANRMNARPANDTKWRKSGRLFVPSYRLDFLCLKHKSKRPTIAIQELLNRDILPFLEERIPACCLIFAILVRIKMQNELCLAAGFVELRKRGWSVDTCRRDHESSI